MDTSIQVSIRMKPNSESIESRWKIVDKRMISLKENPTHSFQFDHIFDERASTEEIYSEICSPIIQSYLEGFNATIFVYGQTASGKSFTMLGDGNDQSFGIIPSSLFEMFDLFGQRPNRQYHLSVSCMEIYNEKITDLLNTSNSSVKIREDRNGSVAVTSLTEVACKNIEDVIDVLSAGNANRSTGETNFSLRSSRAHTIVTLHLKSRDITAENSSTTVSALNLVDLAGSERPSTSTNETQQFKEGTYINSSLLALGNVISSLSEGRSHIPYRDSKLTRILQSSLGGNSKTLIICTTSPSSVDETMSTLRFASRAKKIKNKPIINQTETRGWAQSDKVTAHFGTQTYPSVVDSCTQTTPPVMPPPPQTSDAQVQTLSSYVLVHDQPDQCVFTELNQSYLCHHRTYADSTARALDNVIFVNDEYSVELAELKDMIELKDTIISELQVKLKIREEANEAQEEMLCGLQMKLKGMTNESAKEIWYLKMYLEETEETLSRFEGIEKELFEAEENCEQLKKENGELLKVSLENATLKRSVETLTKELKTLEMCLQESEESLDKLLGIEKELSEEEAKSMELSAENIKLKRELEALNDSNGQGLHEKCAKEIQYLKVYLEETEETLSRFEGIEKELFEAEENCEQLKKENGELLKVSLEREMRLKENIGSKQQVCCFKISTEINKKSKLQLSRPPPQPSPLSHSGSEEHPLPTSHQDQPSSPPPSSENETRHSANPQSPLGFDWEQSISDQFDVYGSSHPSQCRPQ